MKTPVAETGKSFKANGQAVTQTKIAAVDRFISLYMIISWISKLVPLYVTYIHDFLIYFFC